MHILGIESSCDDTSVALVEASDDGFVVIAEKTASQVDVHKHYGGVVPELAGRMHAEAIGPLIEEVLEDQRTENKEQRTLVRPDVIAVTAGPGLVTGLLVGVEAARTLSYLWNVPLVAVNHIEGHIHSVLISDFRFPISDFEKDHINHNLQSAICNLQFPAVALIVSGGHTELILMTDFGLYELIGKTKDDAAGECFDKVGKMLGFEYPGGPKISKHAEHGDPSAIPFPRPMIKSDDFDFSFAGLKTAALYWLRDHTQQKKLNNNHATAYCLDPIPLRNFCASFEQAIVDVLVTKTIRAAKKYNAKTVILAGGVSANKKLRETLQTRVTTPNCELRTPNVCYTMDNGAMIAAAGYHHAKKGDFTPWESVFVDPNWHVYGEPHRLPNRLLAPNRDASLANKDREL